jgi:Glycosyl hydrolases family 39
MKRRELIGWVGGGVTIAFVGDRLLNGDIENPFTDNLNVSSSAAEEGNSVKVNVDWKNAIAQTTPLLFGSNDYEITDLNKAKDLVFQKHLQDLDIGLIRIHHKELSDRWTNATTKTWDENKIKAVFDVSYPQKPTIVQNIPGWTKWMKTDGDGLLDSSEYDRYADFCADLVTILNQRQHRNILYWEPFNEKEQEYEKAGKLDQLWQIYNLAAKAMKSRDSRIKVGGPALTWDNDRVLASFLDRCGDNVDFISWHRYASGDAKESNEKILAYPPEYKEQVKRFRAIAAKYIRGRTIPLFLSEYNINFTWDSGETRQNNHIGAVWFASSFKHLAESGIEMAASWHLKDGIYGIIDPSNKLRPAANVFTWANKYLIGTVVETKSDRPTLEALAVRQKDGKRSLLLINKSSVATRVKLQTDDKDFAATKISNYYLDEKGVTNKSLTKIDAKGLMMQPYSLSLLRF